MKNKEIENDEYGDEVFASKEAFNRRFRRIEGDELTALKRRIANATKERKSRVTIYFDKDIINRFKERSKIEGVGYQTLMNDAMRRVVDSETAISEVRALQEQILSDKKFLKRLKTALYT